MSDRDEAWNLSFQTTGKRTVIPPPPSLVFPEDLILVDWVEDSDGTRIDNPGLVRHRVVALALAQRSLDGLNFDSDRYLRVIARIRAGALNPNSFLSF